MSGFKQRFFLLITIAILGAGCLPAFAPPSFTSEPTIVYNPNPQAPLAAIVKFSTNKPVRTAIRIKDGEWERELVYDDTHNPELGLPVAGMVPDRTHEISVFIQDKLGRLTEAAETLSFHTLGLPTEKNIFPPIEMSVEQPEAIEPGILLVNTRRYRNGDPEFGRQFSLLVALNGKGKVVWYYQADSLIRDFQRSKNGNLIYITEEGRAMEIDWLGNVQGETVNWSRIREDKGVQPDSLIARIVLKDTSAVDPVGWTIAGVEHLPYIIPCNYCYAYPEPRQPGRRPF